MITYLVLYLWQFVIFLNANYIKYLYLKLQYKDKKICLTIKNSENKNFQNRLS